MKTVRLKCIEYDSISSIYLKTVIDAIKDIKSEVISQQIELSDGNNKLKVYERNVVISIAYEIGKTYGAGASICNNIQLINGEVLKRINIPELSTNYNRITGKNLREDTNINIIPDFLIHQSHDCSSIDGDCQYLIMEAKSQKYLSRKHFNWDLFKLNLYIDKLNYDVAVYLIIGKTYKSIERFLIKYVQSGFFISVKISKLFFLIKQDINESPLEIYQVELSNR